ncbi:hypothetical protein FQA39_LY09445 [Lamprigera yunnana]|nr:hypothetical protein FQA39_LY09445 [Lamprigera yunnana]
MGTPDRKRTSKIPHQKASKQSVTENESKTNSGNFFIECSEKVKLVKDKFSRKKSTQNVKFENIEYVESKKPFDKKKWRMQRYSKKYKLEQWENKRKHAVLQNYRKQINDMPKYDVQKIYEKYGEENENKNNLHLNSTLTHTKQTENEIVQNSKINKKSFKKAKTEFQRIREEQQKEKEELSKKKSERIEAHKRYKQQKLEKYKKLSKKTKKGQPIMKDVANICICNCGTSAFILTSTSAIINADVVQAVMRNCEQCLRVSSLDYK